MRVSLTILATLLLGSSAFAQEFAFPTNPSDDSADARLLEQRQAELVALQAEVAELQEKLGVEKEQVCVIAKIYELSHNALRAQSVDVSKGALAAFLSPASPKPEASGNRNMIAGRQTIPFSVAPDINDAIMKQLETWTADPARPAKLLASPALTTPLGKAAYMNIGGEFPVVVPQSLGTTSIEFRRYGTQLDATATKTPEGNIELRVRPRVSRLDSSRTVKINGLQVPGLEVHECDLAVILRPAQTLIVSGLVQSRTTAPKQVGRRGAVQPAVSDQIETVMVITVDFISSESKTATNQDTATAAKPTATITR